MGPVTASKSCKMDFQCKIHNCNGVQIQGMTCTLRISFVAAATHNFPSTCLDCGACMGKMHTARIKWI